MRLSIRVAVAACVGATTVAGCVAPPNWGGGPAPTTSTTSTSTTSTSTSTTTTLLAGPAVRRVSSLAGGESSGAVVSRNGRYVAFTSTSTALGADGNGPGLDVFRWDRTTGTVLRLTGGNAPATTPTVADDGAVAFESTATDLAGADANNQGSDVFLWTASGVVRVTAGNFASGNPVISSDGTRVVLHSFGDLAGVGSAGAVSWRRVGGTFTRLVADTVGHTYLPRAVTSTGNLVLLDDGGSLRLHDTSVPSSLATVAEASSSPPFTFVIPMAGVHALADDGDVVYTNDTVWVLGTPTVVSGSLARYDRQTGSTVGLGNAAVPIAAGQSPDGRYVVSTEIASGAAFTIGALGTVRHTDRTTGVVTTVAAAATGSTLSSTGRDVAFDSNRLDPAPDANGAGLDAFSWDRGS